MNWIYQDIHYNELFNIQTFPKRKNKLCIRHFLFPLNVDTYSICLMDKIESYANFGRADLGISEKFVYKGTLPRTFSPVLDLYLTLLWSARERFLGSKYLLGKCLAQSENRVQLFFCEIYNRLSTPSDNWISLKSAKLYRDIIREADGQTSPRRQKKSKKNLFVYLHLMHNQRKFKICQTEEKYEGFSKFF